MNRFSGISPIWLAVLEDSSDSLNVDVLCKGLDIDDYTQSDGDRDGGGNGECGYGSNSDSTMSGVSESPQLRNTIRHKELCTLDFFSDLITRGSPPNASKRSAPSLTYTTPPSPDLDVSGPSEEDAEEIRALSYPDFDRRQKILTRQVLHTHRLRSCPSPMSSPSSTSTSMNNEQNTFLYPMDVDDEEEIDNLAKEERFYYQWHGACDSLDADGSSEVCDSTCSSVRDIWRYNDQDEDERIKTILAECGYNVDWMWRRSGECEASNSRSKRKGLSGRFKRGGQYAKKKLTPRSALSSSSLPRQAKTRRTTMSPRERFCKMRRSISERFMRKKTGTTSGTAAVRRSQTPRGTEPTRTRKS